MNLFDYPLLTDENIHPLIVKQLRTWNLDVTDVMVEGLSGQPDTAVLQAAYQSGRAVLTHDSDFGTLAIAQQRPFTGIIYLRPGHIKPEFTLATLNAIKRQDIEVESPFIIVAARKQNVVRIRVRQL